MVKDSSIARLKEAKVIVIIFYDQNMAGSETCLKTNFRCFFAATKISG